MISLWSRWQHWGSLAWLAQALECCIFIGSLAFCSGWAFAQAPARTHSDEEISRFRTYRGPSASAPVLNLWRTNFLSGSSNRAFAVSDDGQQAGSTNDWTSEDQATKTALDTCNASLKRAGKPGQCRLYAVNDRIVYPGAEAQLSTISYEIGDFRLRGGDVLYGPQRATGVIIHGHGYYGHCVEQRKYGVAPFIGQLRLSQWDLLRFDRDPCYDNLTYGIDRLAASLPKARTAGYKQVILAGHSRGAWQIFDALARDRIAEPITAIIATSPGAHGSESNAYTAPAAWRDMLSRIRPLNARTVIFFFDWDNYVVGAAERARATRKILLEKGTPHMVIFEADASIVRTGSNELNGHGGAGRPAFTGKYAACTLRFIQTGVKSGACALEN